MQPAQTCFSLAFYHFCMTLALKKDYNIRTNDFNFWLFFSSQLKPYRQALGCIRTTYITKILFCYYETLTMVFINILLVSLTTDS